MTLSEALTQIEANFPAAAQVIREMVEKAERYNHYEELYIHVCANLANAVTHFGIKGHGGENVDDIIIDYAKKLEAKLAAATQSEGGCE